MRASPKGSGRRPELEDAQWAQPTWVEQATVRTAAAERPAAYPGHALWAAEIRSAPADDRRARPLPGVAPRLAPYVLSYRGSDGRAPVSSESGTLDA